MKQAFASILLLLAVPVIVFIVYFVYTKNNSVLPKETIVAPIEKLETAKSGLAEIDKKVNGFTASFEIYTNGTKRVFTDLMYHNLSSDVYIAEPDPSVIHVKKAGITWDDFFKTLPFTLTKECLTTGTKQVFCTNQTQKLQFILNDTENPNTLELEIREGDRLVVNYE